MTNHFLLNKKLIKYALNIEAKFGGQSTVSKFSTKLNPILGRQANQRTLPFAEVLI